MKTSSAILAIAATLGLASVPAIANASLYHLNPAALVPANQSVMHAQGIAVADSSHASRLDLSAALAPSNVIALLPAPLIDVGRCGPDRLQNQTTRPNERRRAMI